MCERWRSSGSLGGAVHEVLGATREKSNYERTRRENQIHPFLTRIGSSPKLSRLPLAATGSLVRDDGPALHPLLHEPLRGRIVF